MYFQVPTVLWAKRNLEAKKKVITFSYGRAWCSLFMFQADFFQSYQVLC